jgi:aryl-alcohol dehydrogenase-like predicted oxidoreductase
MRQNSFGKLPPVSALTLGGGGIGTVWGETTFDECVASVHAAVAAGINLIDLAPRYGDGKAEQVVGDAFAGRLPDGVRVTSKCNLGNPSPERSNLFCGDPSKAASNAFDCRGSTSSFSIRMWCPTRTISRSGPMPPAA